MPQWGTFIEVERRNRILVATWAYAYEFETESMVSDAKFDEVCRSINPDVDTGHKILDKFFATEFNECTGQWIHDHPELHKVKARYEWLKMIDNLPEVEEEDPLS